MFPDFLGITRCPYFYQVENDVLVLAANAAVSVEYLKVNHLCHTSLKRKILSRASPPNVTNYPPSLLYLKILPQWIRSWGLFFLLPQYRTHMLGINQFLSLSKC